MAKKKKHKFGKHRNAAPRAPKPGGDTSMHQLGYTAAGAAGTALLGSFLASEHEHARRGLVGGS